MKRGQVGTPKVKITELLNKTDTRLLKETEAQGTVMFLNLGILSLSEVSEMLMN